MSTEHPTHLPKQSTKKGGPGTLEPERSGPGARAPFSTPQLDLGGQTTISPPAKVKSATAEDSVVLASGIDSLYLALDVSWTNQKLFDYLGELKTKAVLEDAETIGQLPLPSPFPPWPFVLQPFGTKGYEWLLVGQEFALKIGNWLEPKSRPSIMVEIRSETLWHLGAEKAVKRVIAIVLSSGGCIVAAKPSRADLCLDLLLPDAFWSLKLLDYRVTRAEDMAPYFKHKALTGFRIGSGAVSARLYDKDKEIQKKSKKFWMFDIWGLTEVPEGYKAIRIEFQLRREALKDLALNNTDDLLQFTPNAWAYCTQRWLKFQDRPGLHHTQRKTLPWWQTVQEGFEGAQEARPLIRAKALRVDKKQIIQQAYGLLTSLAAIHEEEAVEELSHPPDLGDCLGVVFDSVELLNQDKGTFSERVQKKRTKYHRTQQKEEKTRMKRRELKFPVE